MAFALGEFIDAQRQRGEGLATFDATPKFPFSGNDEVLVERIGMGGDLDPFTAAGDYGEHSASGRDDPHKPADRRYFIGGSDARIIMGPDEAALLRLWCEKRGEVEPEDLSGNLVVQLGVAGCRTCRCTSVRTCPELASYQRRFQRTCARSPLSDASLGGVFADGR